ncbi:Triose phosphate/phosphate translocator, non-green plastid, chloroplast precursor, putative [Ricinus communis]|uniref:Triose phosphate/phosphate translocator, non-green plastid, chloroplast, putative n=1 Tax=Ricinus communis TaxID=3988 RepID=B9SIR5_RICCO|nr:Triose phosphate/phosphate translocator, non-green plastid, chloroplast precursor, putative [Ricinus communis]|eukprot:XP_002525884.1 probable sugar phosphate/phosphate translocator At1g06470 [Ricinus communis]
MLDDCSSNNREVIYNPSEIQNSPIQKDPFFSHLCDEVANGNFEHQLENSDATVEDSDFELPLVHQPMIENGNVDTDRFQCNKTSQNESAHSNDSNTMDQEINIKTLDHEINFHTMDHEINIHNRGKEKENYVPFDIENGSSAEMLSSNTSDDCANSSYIPERLPPKSESPVSPADVLKTLFFILVWYTFSTFLTLYNKTLLGDDLGKFPAPLLMNTVHFSMQAVLSKFITWFWSHRFQVTVTMTWKDYFVRVVPTALGTALDVNLSNASLVFISVTFATMCKSAAPIFLLLFAFAFRLESPSIKLLGIIMVISVGVLLTVAKETEFEFWGFVLVMLAAVMSGFRWCMTQILLQKEEYGLKNPLTLMSYVTPVMAMITGLLSLMLDPWHEFKMSSYFDNPWHIARSCLLMFFGGTLAFFMVLTEYVLISVTSAVTVTIAGVVKEAVTILVAVFYFHDEFTWLKGVGLLIIMVGVSLFNWYKYHKLQKHQIGEDDLAESPEATISAKYVILEEMDDQDDTS